MTVYIYKDACPLCQREVRGNEKYKYYCKTCHVLFEKRYLIKAEKKKLSKEEEISTIKELKKINAELPAKAIVESADTSPLKKEEVHIVASAKSNKMHVDTCHFLKKIQKENWIHLDSLAEGVKKGYEPCVCIRRKGLMKI